MAKILSKWEYIYGHNPEHEIWYYYVTKLTNPYFIKTIINRQVGNSLITKISSSALQAQELYESYKRTSLLSKPILLLYALERLAIILILKTNTSNYFAETHGIQYKSNLINIKKRGLFSAFHDCYSDDRSIHQGEYSFKLENLVQGLPVRENDINGIFLREGNDLLLLNIHEEKTDKEVILHGLDREFLFSFALSSLARYKINEWSITSSRDFSKGFDLMLEHFKEPLFPRTISTFQTQNRQMEVFNKENAVNLFDYSKFVDCKINAYPSHTDYKGINLQPLNFLFIDLDKSSFKT